MKCCPGTQVDEMDALVSRFTSLFSQNCAFLWGATLDSRSENSNKICLIGVY